MNGSGAVWKTVYRPSRASGSRPPSRCRVLGAYGRLIWKYFAMRPDYDVMVVGYPGQFDLFLARLLSWQHRRPLAWDVLMSIYLVAVERRLHEKSPGMVDMIRRLEQISVRCPDLLVMDTEEYAAWFGRVYGVPRVRFRLVPIGADSSAFQPTGAQVRPTAGARTAGRPFRVLYYGTFIENHGVPTIVEAAKLLEQHGDIRFELIGDGPERPVASDLVHRYGLQNVRMVGWLDQAALRDRIAAADLCLGVFGITPQSMMTVHNKIKECMAMAKPVLTGDSPAVRDAFVHERHLYLCRRADPLALAAAIGELQQHHELRSVMAAAGREKVLSDYTIERNGERFKAILGDVAMQASRGGAC